MKNYILLLIIVIITLNSCNKNRVYTNLLRVPHLKEHFSKEEIKELSEALIEFENLLFEKSKSNDLSGNYSEFCIVLKKIQTNPELIDEIKSYIPKNSKIFQHISNEVFSKIWIIETGYNKDTGISQKSLTLKMDGQYAKFINDFSQTSPILKDYAESLEISGCLSPAMVSIFQKRWEELDFNDMGTRLIIAIHYITLADSSIAYKE